jgi:hypothetical protein
VNTQLVEFIIHVVQALPEAEQTLIIKQLNQILPQALASESSVVSLTDAETIDPDAWEVWRSLGDDAVSGQLENPSVNHDRYLYAKDQ